MPYDSPPQTRTTTNRFSSRFSGGVGGGVGSMQPGTKVSVYGGTGGQAAKAEARALETKSAQDAARNRMIQKTLKRQRVSQKRLMKRSRKQIGKTGKAERRRLRERGTQFAAVGEQRMIDRGLGQTTVAGAFERGVEADTQRNIGEQRSRQAGQLAGLFSREAGMQIPQGSLGLQGINQMSGGLEEYLRLIMMMNSGVS